VLLNSFASLMEDTPLIGAINNPMMQLACGDCQCSVSFSILGYGAFTSHLHVYTITSVVVAQSDPCIATFSDLL
jgi:hypothetical protein